MYNMVTIVDKTVLKKKKEEEEECALTGVAQWAGHHPTKRKVTSSIPAQGTYLGCGPGPLWGYARGNQLYISVSLPFSRPSPSLKTNKIFFFKEVMQSNI